ncbi:hypothetical protein [Aquabacterium humicola]|uniref:hypothetical protein n=1 Tax=Aquabacterium humicola TaxID=3237377 RepID=UPI002543E91C|nr:hypothetical protein [Rubrivivax pictus]
MTDPSPRTKQYAGASTPCPARRTFVCCSALVLATSTAGGQAADVRVLDYLALLERIAPAAGTGARAYVHAFSVRCGRAMAAAELRRAMSEGDGEPVLMAMIRASELRGGQDIERLKALVPCPRREQRP